MIISVKVKPNSSKRDLIKISENNYVANLKSVPEKGKANNELLKLISKEFSIPIKNIALKGKSSRIKTVKF